MKVSKMFLQVLFLSLSASLCILADVMLTAEDMEKQKINYKMIEPVNLSPKGDYFVALEKVLDLETKLKGSIRILHVFRFANDKLSKIDSIPLPITQHMNAVLSDRKNEVFVVGNHGNKILRVNLDKMQVDVLFEYKRGLPGFKADGVMCCNKGAFYATGWFYDQSQVWQGEYMVRLDVAGNKVSFTKKVDTHKLFKQNENAVTKAFYYVSGDVILYNVIKPKEEITELMMYRSGESVLVDKGMMLNVFIGTDNRAFYTVRVNKEKFQHFVKDVPSKKSWKIGYDNIDYTYPFFSEKGDVLIVTRLNLPRKTLDAMFGVEKENFRLKTFLKTAPLGPMKFAASGKYYVHMGKELFTFAELK